MWLRNYYAINSVNNHFTNTSFKNASYTGFTQVLGVNPNGNIVKFSNAGYTSISNLLDSVWVTSFYTGLKQNEITIDVGIDNTPVRYSDYNLGSPLTSSSIAKTIVDVGNVEFNFETGKYSQTISMDLKNITDSDIVIKEWGIYDNKGIFGTVLIKRTVFERKDWKTVPAQSYCRIDFTYDLDMSSIPAECIYGFKQDTIADSWDTIIAKANAGMVDDYNIHDTKSFIITVDGVDYIAQAEIAGKSCDTISGTNNKAALTFAFVAPFEKHSMNETDTNSGGWLGVTGDHYNESQDLTDGVLNYGCGMRKFLSTIQAKNTTINNNVQIVDKKYDDANDSVQTCKDKWWLFAYPECGTDPHGAPRYTQGQGTVYPIFDNTDETKNRKYIGSSVPWWLRSRSTYDAQGFLHVGVAGDIYSQSEREASKEHYCLVGFCIGVANE